jgi:flagellar hook-length control protein FliK
MGPALASTLAGVGVGRADSLQFQQWINAVQGGRSATIDPSPGRGEQFSESSPGSSEWIPTSIESAGEVRHDAGLQAHRDSYRSTSAQAEVDLTAELEAAQAEGADESAREALRQRVSETVAQRMASQLTRGQMSLHLELKPADLGRVTIEMTLHNGRIEAVFDAATLSARTLISEGLDRLRHELERAGMNVAHLGLQSGSGGSSGGKPTPGRSDRRGDANGGELTVAGQEQVVSESASRRQRDRGLDLMV